MIMSNINKIKQLDTQRQMNKAFKYGSKAGKQYSAQPKRK